MIAFGLLAAVLLLLVLLEAYDRTQPKYVATKQLKGPGIHLPLIGNSYIFGMFNSLSGWTELRKYAKMFPTGYYFYYFHRLFYVIHTAEPFEDVMLLTNTKKGLLYDFLQPFLGEGILTSHSSKWFDRRRLITPAFHFKILRKFFPTFCSHSDGLVDHIKTKQNTRLNVHEMFEEFSLNLICETSIGITPKDTSEYHNALVKYGDLITTRNFSFWAHPDFLFRWLGYKRRFDSVIEMMHNFTRRMIAKRRLRFELSQHNKRIENDNEDDGVGYKRNQTAFLDTLLAAQIEHGSITDDGIQEEVDTFVFTGHDTIAAGMTYIMLCIAEHPHVQQKLIEEIESVLHDDPITVHNIAACTYMDLVIKEALRILPPVPMIMRELIEDATLNGIHVPAGTHLILHIVDLHRDPRWFPNPMEFIPERFLPENVEKRHRFAYLPFSAGVRNCIGQKYAMMEIKTMLIKVIKAYRMEAVTKIKDLVIVTDMVLHTNHPVEIKFFSRQAKRDV